MGGSEGKIQLVHLDIGVWLDEIRAEALPPLHLSGIVDHGIRGFLWSHTLVWLGRWRGWGIVVPSATRCIINRSACSCVGCDRFGWGTSCTAGSFLTASIFPKSMMRGSLSQKFRGR